VADVVVLLNGAVGAWDEIAIAAVAILVLWIAVKLAGRKPPTDDDEDASAAAANAKRAEEQDDTTHRPEPGPG
jgi:hypothetical protein